MTRYICPQCGVSHEAELLMVKGVRVFERMLCDRCDRQLNADAFTGEDPQPRPSRDASDWAAICPPRYRDVQQEHLPEPAQQRWERVMAWRPEQGRGLGLIGATGHGKSMLLHHLASQLYLAHYDVHLTYMTHFAFLMGSMDQRERRQELKRCCQSEILLMDDIDKAKMTDRVEPDFYHVLETRLRWERPLLCSVNQKGEAMQRNLSVNRGEPIIRRLRESCVMLTV